MEDKNQSNYLGPFIAMVFLFLVVGFLTTANTQFQGPLKEAFLSNVGNLKNTFATLITFSWFLAYPICGSLGSKWVDKYGYKGTLLRALLLMTAGLGFSSLSSFVTTRFPEAIVRMGDNSFHFGFIVFLIGSFVTGASATILQVVINPYLSACTVKGTQAIQRLAIGGTANSIGTTIAPYFVTGIIFGGLAMEHVSVDRILTPFLSLMAVILVLVFTLGFVPLPDIQGTRADGGAKFEKSVWSFSHLSLGVIAIFFYVGAEVCIGGNINLYAIEKGFSSPALLATLYWGGMLVGRLIGSSLSKITPKTQLVFTTVCAAILTVVAIIMDSPAVLVVVGLFHSIMWGAIFTLATAHLGQYTSKASGVFMIGVVGGALLPLLQGVLADLFGGWRFSFFLVLICEAVMLLYALVGSKVKQTAD